MQDQIDRVIESYTDVEAHRRVQKAIDFKEAYKARTGHRPSLVSVIALWQDAEAKLAELQKEVDAQ